MGVVYQDISLPGLESVVNDAMAQPPQQVAVVHLLSPTIALDTSLSYAVPAHLSDAVQVGCLVKVPVAGRTMSGYVIALHGVQAGGAQDRVFRDAEASKFADGKEEIQLKEIASLESRMPLMAPAVYSLAQDVAHRYAGSCAEVLEFAIPKPTQRVDKKYASRLGPQAAVKKMVPDAGPGADAAASLPDSGLASWRAVVSIPRRFGKQSQEYYAAEQAVKQYASGKSALIVTPDAMIRHQVVAAAKELVEQLSFGGAAEAAVQGPENPQPVVVSSQDVIDYSAEDTAAIRYENFLKIKTRSEAGEALLVVGNRNSVFLPMANLAMIVLVDDAHMAYQEDRPPYFHAREVAMLRASAENINFLAVSIVPGLELNRLAQNGWLCWAEESPLAARKALRPLIHSIDNDFDLERDPSAVSARIPTRAYQLVKKALSQGPVLIQVGRHGYAAAVRCFHCRRQARCRHDGGPLKAPVAVAVEKTIINPVEHQHVVCSWCGQDTCSWKCGYCGDSRLQIACSGAIRTAEEIGAAFKEIPVLSSTTANRIDTVDSCPRVVVATPGAEPVAAEGYQAALLLDTQMMLSFDLMDTEIEAVRRWAAAAALVKGRADGGEVMVTGEHAHAVNAFISGNYRHFLHAEYDNRQEVQLPPAVRSALLIATNDTVHEVIRRVEEAVGQRLSAIDLERDTAFLHRYQSFLARHATAAGMWQEDPRQSLIFFSYRQASAAIAALRNYKVKNSGDKSRYVRIIVDPHGLV